MLTQELLIIAADESEISIKILPQELPIKPKKISQLISRSPHSNYFQIDEDIERVAELINLCTKQAKLQQAQQTCQEKGSEITVARRMNAKVVIEISDDYMEADAVITAAYGGNVLSSEDFHVILAMKNITQGLDHEYINNCLINANKKKPGVETRFHIASGLLPVDGEDSTLEYLVEVIENRSCRPQETEFGKVNMYEFGEIISVKAGAALILRHPPTDGTPGRNVIGEERAATPGNWGDLPVVGEGTEICVNDNNLIIASRGGIPRGVNNGLTIDEVLVVKNVDVSYGNITFDGDVMISGDVCEGMKVSSQGDITVNGYVCSATLEAKGNIAVQNGIIGHQLDDEQQYCSCKITAGGTVCAKFSQYSEITAQGGVVIERQLLHCNVDSQGSVLVSNETGSKGTLFGGAIIAGEKIIAVELGGDCGSKTLLKIDGPLTQLRTEKNDLNRTIIKEAQLLKQLLLEHEKMARLSPGYKKRQCLKQLKLDIDKKVRFVGGLQTQRAENESATLEFLLKASIDSTRQLNEGVRFEIYGQHIISKQNYKATEARIIDDKLEINPVS